MDGPPADTYGGILYDRLDGELFVPCVEVYPLREIKFRAWDKEKKQMVELVVMECRFPAYLVNDGKSTSYWIGPERIEVMQSTGLRDKNGKEIYEGDIIKFQNRYMEKGDILGHVRFHEERGAYTFVDTLKENHYGVTISDSCDNGICDSENVEVIGNIYENPDMPLK